jgi:hypothetical protein
MTTNVRISTNYVHPGKKLRVQAVDPKSGALYRELTIDQKKVDEHGGTYTSEELHVHDGSKLIIEEVE